MALYEISPARAPRRRYRWRGRWSLFAFALVVAHAVYLAPPPIEGILADRAERRRRLPSDFVNVWAAGRLALCGHAAAAYDWPTHKLIEGSRRRPCLRRLFRLALSADLFVCRRRSSPCCLIRRLTSPGRSARSSAIWSRSAPSSATASGYLLAAAFPPVLPNFIVGQNGFLTRGLVGGALVLSKRRPIVLPAFCSGCSPTSRISGCCFRSRSRPAAIGGRSVTAGIVAILMAGASWLAFGSESWLAFLGNIGHTSQAFLSDGWADWSKLQTAFGLRVRSAAARRWPGPCRAAVALAAGRDRRDRVAQQHRLTKSRPRRLATGSLAGDAVSLHVRSRRAGGAARVSVPPRPRARIFAQRVDRHRHRLLCLILIFPFVKVPGGACRARPGRGADRAPRVAPRALRRERAAIIAQIAGGAKSPTAARAVALIGLTLALGYLIVLGGAFLKGNFLDRRARPADRQRFRQCLGCRAAGARWRQPAAAYDWTTAQAGRNSRRRP